MQSEKKYIIGAFKMLYIFCSYSYIDLIYKIYRHLNKYKIPPYTRISLFNRDESTTMHGFLITID